MALSCISRNLGAILRLRTLLSRMQPDVVHSHDSYSNMVVLAALLPNFPTPWVASRRWLDQYVRPSHAQINRLAFRSSSAVAVNSDAIAAHMVRSERIPASKVVVIPNFVELPVETMIPDADIERKRIIVGMVSRLTPVKRHDLALQAIAKLIAAGLHVDLVIVGEGESRADILAAVAAHSLSNHVRLVGDKRGGAQIHLDFDIVLSTSDSEGSPNSVLEAMAAGRPVVATDVGGTRDLVRDGVDGFLVAAGDVEAMTEALKRLVLDPELRSTIGAAGRLRADTYFSPASVSAKLLALYDKISH